MHSWLWAERYPDIADGIIPVASQPVAVTGRNYLWRLMIAIRSDPDWLKGNYKTPPTQFANMLPLFNIMTGSPRMLEAAGRTQADARAALEKIVADARKTFDANDYLY